MWNINNSQETRHLKHPDHSMDIKTKGEIHPWLIRTKEADNQAGAVMYTDTSFSADKAAEKRNPKVIGDETQNHMCNRCDAKRSQDEVKQQQVEQQTIAFNAQTRKSFGNSDIGEGAADVQSKGSDQYTQSNNQACSEGKLKQTKSFEGQHGWPKSGARSLDDVRSDNQHQPGQFSKTREFHNSQTGHAGVDKVTDVDKTARNTNFNSFGQNGGANHQGISDGILTQSRSFHGQHGWPKSNTVNANHIDFRSSYKSDQLAGNSEHGKGYKARVPDQVATSCANEIDLNSREGKNSNFGPYVNKCHGGSNELMRSSQGQNGWQRADMRASDSIKTRPYDGQNEWHKSEGITSSQTDAARHYGQHEPGWSSENSDKARPHGGQSSWQESDMRASVNINTRSFDGLNEWHKSETRTSSQNDDARSYDHHKPGWSSQNSGKARSSQGQNSWQKSDTKASAKRDTADTYASHQAQWPSGHWKQGQGFDTQATDHVDTAHMKADDGKVAGIRSRQAMQEKLFNGHNKWQNLDSRVSDRVDTIHSYDSHHQPGWSSDKARGYDDPAFHHDYVNDADLNVAERSNRYGPYVQSKDRAQPTRSFDGQNEWHKSESRTADHVDAGRSYSHQDPGWSSGKARSFEWRHGWEKSGRIAAGSVDTARSFNQYHPGHSMEHYNGRYQSGWDCNNRYAKQLEVSSDSERQLVWSDGHDGGWNQNGRRAAEEKDLTHAASSATKATENIDGMANEVNEDRSEHNHGEMDMVPPTGSGRQPHLEWGADVQKYPGGDTHPQGQWQAHSSDMTIPEAHGNGRVSIHKNQGNVAASGIWNAETTSHGSGGMGQSDQGQNGRNPGQNGQQSSMSALSDGGQQNIDGAKTTDKMKTAARVEGQ